MMSIHLTIDGIYAHKTDRNQWNRLKLTLPGFELLFGHLLIYCIILPAWIPHLSKSVIPVGCEKPIKKRKIRHLDLKNFLSKLIKTIIN